MEALEWYHLHICGCFTPWILLLFKKNSQRRKRRRRKKSRRGKRIGRREGETKKNRNKMMEEKGQKERRRSGGINTSGTGDSSRSGGHGGGGGGGSGLSEERSLLHCPSVSAYTLVCVCIKHYILSSFICRDVTSFSNLILGFLGEEILSHLLYYHGC